ncbi:MAG: response regulator [Oligoflexales bacterium]
MKKVLIVDDDDFVLEYVDGILQDYYEVLTALDGSIGYDCYMLHKPDLVIIDLVMPVMDGYQLIDKIKVAGDEPEIIILTGAPDEIKQKISYYKIRAVVTKPFKNNDFLRTVKGILEP